MTTVCTVKRIRELVEGMPGDAHIKVQIRDLYDMFDGDHEGIYVEGFSIARIQNDEVVIVVEVSLDKQEEDDE